MKQTLLLIGCGDIALRSASLLRTHYRLIGLCRHLENAPRLRQHGITPVFGDLDSPKTLNKLTGIAHAVLHLAPPPSHGKRDIRTTNLLASLTKRPATNRIILPQRFIYISTSGIKICIVIPDTRKKTRTVYSYSRCMRKTITLCGNNIK